MKVKIDTNKLTDLYLKKVDEISETLEDKTYFYPEEIVRIISNLLEQNSKKLITKDSKFVILAYNLRLNSAHFVGANILNISEYTLIPKIEWAAKFDTFDDAVYFISEHKVDSDPFIKCSILEIDNIFDMEVKNNPAYRFPPTFGP